MGSGPLLGFGITWRRTRNHVKTTKNVCLNVFVKMLHFNLASYLSPFKTTKLHYVCEIMGGRFIPVRTKENPHREEQRVATIYLIEQFQSSSETNPNLQRFCSVIGQQTRATSLTNQDQKQSRLGHERFLRLTPFSRVVFAIIIWSVLFWFQGTVLKI